MVYLLFPLLLDFCPHLCILSLQAIRHEAYTHMEGEKEFVQIEPNDLYPYLLVNVGSGVSIIKVFVYFANSTQLGDQKICIEQIDFHVRLFKV